MNCSPADPDTAAVLIVVATTPQLDDKVRLWGELALKRGKPTAILLTPGTLVDDARATLRELHCPFTNRMDDALRVLKAAIHYGKALRTPAATPACPADFGAVATFTAPSAALTESETKALLGIAGIAAAATNSAHSELEAVESANAIGYPVVLKVSSRTLAHKSDVGGVQLDLRSDEAVRAAWQRIRDNVATLAAGALECVVQPMVSGGMEVIVGSKWDDQFGAVVMVGAGGIWAETLRDTQLALAPVAPRARIGTRASLAHVAAAGGRSRATGRGHR